MEPLDYQQLARELAPFLQSARMTIIEEGKTSIEFPTPALETCSNQEPILLSSQRQSHARGSRQANTSQEEKLAHAYQALLKESPGKRISARALSERAKVRRITCSAWLNLHHQQPEAPALRTDASIDQSSQQTQDGEAILVVN